MNTDELRAATAEEILGYEKAIETAQAHVDRLKLLCGLLIRRLEIETVEAAA